MYNIDSLSYSIYNSDDEYISNAFEEDYNDGKIVYFNKENNKKYYYIKGNFLEKYIKENIRQNDIKIMIVDDVYTTGATMKNILEMIENNIMKNLGNEEKQKIEYIFFSLAKD